jgi:hypothetical protein
MHAVTIWIERVFLTQLPLEPSRKEFGEYLLHFSELSGAISGN